MKDTIFALSTVPGLSAISVFRISGPNSFSILKMTLLKMIAFSQENQKKNSLKNKHKNNTKFHLPKIFIDLKLN